MGTPCFEPTGDRGPQLDDERGVSGKADDSRWSLFTGYPPSPQHLQGKDERSFMPLTRTARGRDGVGEEGLRRPQGEKGKGECGSVGKVEGWASWTGVYGKTTTSRGLIPPNFRLPFHTAHP